jgi:hypothetical protein
MPVLPTCWLYKQCRCRHTLYPPVLSTSADLRPRMRMRPSKSLIASSPVRNQSSKNASRVASGRFQYLQANPRRECYSTQARPCAPRHRATYWSNTVGPAIQSSPEWPAATSTYAPCPSSSTIRTRVPPIACPTEPCRSGAGNQGTSIIIPRLGSARLASRAHTATRVPRYGLLTTRPISVMPAKEEEGENRRESLPCHWMPRPAPPMAHTVALKEGVARDGLPSLHDGNSQRGRATHHQADARHACLAYLRHSRYRALE